MIYTEKEILNRWILMLSRCGKLANYEDVTICEVWKNFNNFKEWFSENEYATKQWKLEVDKDLFGNESKIYSPDTCCLIPKSMNILLASCTSRNGLLPGVEMTKNNTYKATIKRACKAKSRVFKTEEEAFRFYKAEKERIIKIAAEAYSFLLPEHIYKAFLTYEVKPIRRICQYPENLKKNIEVEIL